MHFEQTPSGLMVPSQQSPRQAAREHLAEAAIPQPEQGCVLSEEARKKLVQVFAYLDREYDGDERIRELMNLFSRDTGWECQVYT